jgi:hypothetical protein
MRVPFLLLIVAALSSASSSQDWPMYQHDPGHSGSSGAPSSANLSSFGVLWTYQADGVIPYPPAVADFDGDHRMEVVFATQGGMLHLLNGTGVAVWAYDAKSLITSPPAVVYDGANVYIAFTVAEGDLLLLDSGGGLVWRYPSGKEIYSLPVSAADVNGDGRPEIVFGSNAVGLDGAPVSPDSGSLISKGVAEGFDLVADLRVGGLQESYSGVYPYVPTRGDVNGDGRDELIRFSENASAPHRSLYVITGKGYAYRSFDADFATAPPTNVDVDGDMKSDLILCGQNGRLRIILAETGDIIDLKAPGERCAGAVPADINGDSSVEVVTVSYDGSVAVFGSVGDSDGDGLGDFKEDMIGTNRMLADTDGDGVDDTRDEDPLTPRTPVRAAQETGWSPDGDIVAVAGLGLVICILVAYAAKTALGNGRSKSSIELTTGGRTRPRSSSFDDASGSVQPMGKHASGGSQMGAAWDSILAAEASGQDDSLMRGILDVVSAGGISSEDAAVKLKVSRVKLASHMERLEKMGYVIVDSSDPSNPSMKPTGKSRDDMKPRS